MSRTRAFVMGAGALVGTLSLVASAWAISRTEVIVSAKGYAHHPWTCTNANLTASCAPAYQSAYLPGDYMGLPYDWGGYMGTFEFDQGIANGLGAGSYPADGELDCTVGLDCSGFVSKAWHEGHYGTSGIPSISSAITQAELLAGDCLNEAGYHVVLFSNLLGNGDPVFYESVFYNVHLSMPGWSWVDGFTPRRYQNITGSSAGDPVGTAENPIVIGSFPYSDSRDTSQSASDVIDGCGLAPSTAEDGPEYIYQLTLTQPGTITATVADDVNVDIDIELFTSMNTSDCLARHNTTITQSLDCGTYLLVADTFSSGSTEYPGPYTLNVTFTPSGGNCGSGPPVYDFEGKPGDPCSNQYNPNLPFCNPNLGADTCLYTQTDSACTKACQNVGDCGDFPGGCCHDIGTGELYCEPADWCGGGTGGAGGMQGGGGSAGWQGEGGQGPGAGGPGGSGTGANGTGANGTGANGTGASGPSGNGNGATANDAGCGCRLGGSEQPHSQAGWLGALAALGLVRRRRASLPAVAPRGF